MPSSLRRIETRVDDDRKRWIEEAAAREGRSIANFLLRLIDDARVADIQRRRGKRGGK